jgi:hypothetical protein
MLGVKKMKISLSTRLNTPIENDQYSGSLPYKDIHDNELYMKTYSAFGDYIGPGRQGYTTATVLLLLQKEHEYLLIQKL